MSTTQQTLHHLEVNGGQLAYALEGSGTPPVVLLHAGYVDHRMYARELEHLARRTTTVAPDARTHGQSSTAMAPFRHCDDVAALVRHLDLGPAVLIGTSMGAGAAVDTALEHPDAVRALVLSGAGTSEPTFTSPEALELLHRAEQAVARQDVAAWLEATLAWAAGPERDLSDVDAAVGELLSDLHQEFVRTHIRPGVVPPEAVAKSWERLDEITVPVLGIVGELDFTDHHEMTERAVSAVRDGRGVVRIPNAGHYPNLEQPTAWERAVDDFLGDVLSG
ncbi:alpha/beta hydrolase [Ornithinimicrobium sp. F0845]|uniref:alpha/beta fold hydrolase n=1 Tax=Ornithinimicrobium sp. F0845 TaxID=2926412 RepID=UPI001FF25C67|nr:alpha/beta hydrolase [Ornithinimicrobium sp. F0845]MCK0113766.1 alpha/beta hydrolase [Ornithinimicrobium sp. F0845]